MKTKQTAIVLSLTLCISSFFLTQSCTEAIENDEQTFTQEQKEIIQQYSYIGIEHNDIMAMTYDRLNIKTKGSSRITKEKLVEATKIATKKALIDIQRYNEQVIDFEKFYHVGISNNKTKSDKVDKTYFEFVIDTYASNNLKKLVTELIAISNNYNQSIHQHKNKVDRLNKLAFSTLNEEELSYFLMGSSVAIASFEYWQANFDDWCELAGVQPIPKVKSGGMETVYQIMDGMTGADVGGAVGGAITGAIGGAAAGAGIGAGPGAAIGAVAGGCGASTGKVIENIINMW